MAAYVASLVDADLLILMSDIEGCIQMIKERIKRTIYPYGRTNGAGNWKRWGRDLEPDLEPEEWQLR